jgi:hypothetical protein
MENLWKTTKKRSYNFCGYLSYSKLLVDKLNDYLFSVAEVPEKYKE